MQQHAAATFVLHLTWKELYPMISSFSWAEAAYFYVSSKQLLSRCLLLMYCVLAELKKSQQLVEREMSETTEQNAIYFITRHRSWYYFKYLLWGIYQKVVFLV